MDIMKERARVVAAVLDDARRLHANVTTREELARLQESLARLARRTELFPEEQFPAMSKNGTLYRLSEDGDRQYALYAFSGVKGKTQPVHNHTTWAAIAGVCGDELNTCYERIDNRSNPKHARLKLSREVTVGPGGTIGFLTDDFHTIVATSDGYALHLHLYGVSLERLPARIIVDPESCVVTEYVSRPRIFTPRIDIAALDRMLGDGDELAILDVREEGQFLRGHLFHATNCPLSRLELLISKLVPRSETRIVVVGEEDEWDQLDLANRAATRLALLGYRNLAVLAGGVAGWSEGGHEIYRGLNVPSKAFGEMVDHEARTPYIRPAELHAMLEARGKTLVLDCRTYDEFNRRSIPGAINVPGGELALRILDVAPDPETVVVVNCAGRTRSILGTQSLINVGIPNRVVALENGTMGWELAGLKLEQGAERRFGALSAKARDWAAPRAAIVAAQAGVKAIDRNELDRLKADSRSLFVFDVRDPAEYRTGHLPGARSAPGGQLVLITDNYVGVRNARLVLVDDDGVRAAMAGSWLAQAGWPEVYMLKADPSDLTVTGAEPEIRAAPISTSVSGVDPFYLATLLADGQATVIDVATSEQYRGGHIPGAWFAVRSRFANSLKALPQTKHVILTSPDGRLAALSAEDAADALGREVSVLAGGTAAWRDAGQAMERGLENMADQPDDIWHRPQEAEEDRKAAMEEYLSWEKALAEQLGAKERAAFRILSSKTTRS